MLKNAKTFSSFSVDDLEKAQEFYSQPLGLDVKKDDMGNLDVSLLGGASLLIYPKGQAHTPATFTVLNFLVENLEETVDQLIEKGITFEQYDNEYMKTDEKGISRAPEGKGPSIAWFKDPAGNILSVIEDK